jgi:KipI family sensor histidine kinase inhibitor
MTEIVVRPAGDRAVLIEVPDTAAAARVAVRLRAGCPALVDVVPGHRTVLATWHEAPPDDVGALAAAAVDDASNEIDLGTVTIAVTYDGPDLDEVAGLTGLSTEALVTMHSAPLYTVAFIGFAPGFAYLTGGDPRLHVPRRSTPRTHVPAGSVALAGPYSGVYPREGPGGWQLLGRTSTVLFDPERTPPATLAPGHRVQFVAG